MEPVRLTPSERRILEEIESELRKDQDLDLALSTMHPARDRRRAKDRTPSGRRRGGRRGVRRPGAGTWQLLLVVVLCAAVFAALMTTSPAYLVVVGFALITLACTTALVWLCISLMTRRGRSGPGGP